MSLSSWPSGIEAKDKSRKGRNRAILIIILLILAVVIFNRILVSVKSVKEIDAANAQALIPEKGGKVPMASILNTIQFCDKEVSVSGTVQGSEQLHQNSFFIADDLGRTMEVLKNKTSNLPSTGQLLEVTGVVQCTPNNKPVLADGCTRFPCKMDR